MKKFIKAFLFLGLLFFVWDLIKSGFKYVAIKDVILLTGSFSIVLTLAHFITIMLKGYKLNERALVVMNNSRIYDIKNLAKKNNWKLIKENHEELIYKTRFGFNSYGERIEIRKKGKDLVISSVGLFLFPIFDFGKNLDNIKLIRTVVK